MASTLTIGGGQTSLTSNIVFNKWVLIAITGIIIYLMGGFDVIADNPALVVFAGLILFIIMFTRGKK